jgi:hypothetical protein
MTYKLYNNNVKFNMNMVYIQLRIERARTDADFEADNSAGDRLVLGAGGVTPTFPSTTESRARTSLRSSLSGSQAWTDMLVYCSNLNNGKGYSRCRLCVSLDNDQVA